MTTTVRAFRRKEGRELSDNIRACIAWTVPQHKPIDVHLNPSVVNGESIDGLPIIPDKYTPPGEIWIGFEKE